MTTQTGLPHATRTFEFRFTLNGVPANPSSIQGELFRFNKQGKKVVVQSLVNGDFVSGVETGVYEVTVQPDTYGEFFIRAWTSGDVKTQDSQKSFTVPTPGVG